MKKNVLQKELKKNIFQKRRIKEEYSSKRRIEETCIFTPYIKWISSTYPAPQQFFLPTTEEIPPWKCKMMENAGGRAKEVPE